MRKKKSVEHPSARCRPEPSKGLGLGTRVPTTKDSLLSPPLCWRRVQPGGWFVQSQVCKKTWQQQQLRPRCRAARSPPRLSCLPVVAAAGKCFSSDQFQSCHSVIPCAMRQKTPPRPPSPAHLFPCTLSSCSRSLAAVQGNHQRCDLSSGIFFYYYYSFLQVLNHPYYPFLIN